MADQLGFQAVSSTVRFSFTTHAASGAPVAPSSAFENSDLRIYKDGSATQRSSASGITMTSPFDSVTGGHHVDIDLSDNTDAGFYADGSFYEVWLVPDETVDSLAVTKILAYFRIGVQPANVTQVSGDSTAADNLENAYDDTAGSVPWVGIVDQGTAQSVGANDIVLRAAAAFVDDALIGCTVVITNGTQVGSRSIITDYVGATDTATLGNGWTGATPTGTPTYKIFASAAASGVAQTGDSFARLGAPAGASVSADIAAVKVDTAATLIDTAEIGAAGAGLTNINLPNQTMDIVGNITGNLSGSVGSVTGAVGSVTGLTASNLDATISSRATPAQVNTEVDTALADYDGPTNAEMEARTLTAALIAKLTSHLGGLATGLVAAGSTTTTVVFNATTGINGGVPSATNDFYNGRVIIFLTGTLALQATSISDYTGSTVTATVVALTSAPSAGDTFILV